MTSTRGARTPPDRWQPVAAAAAAYRPSKNNYLTSAVPVSARHQFRQENTLRLFLGRDSRKHRYRGNSIQFDWIAIDWLPGSVAACKILDQILFHRCILNLRVLISRPLETFSFENHYILKWKKEMEKYYRQSIIKSKEILSSYNLQIFRNISFQNIRIPSPRCVILV